MKKQFTSATKASITSIFLAIIAMATLAMATIPEIAHGQVQAPNYDPRQVGSPLELHVTNDGKVSAHGARVEQIAGSVIYAKIYWGVAFLRMTIRTTTDTKITKRVGDPIPLTAIKVGDFISIEGDFFAGSTSFDLTAKTIKNWSLQTGEKEFKGTITQSLASANGVNGTSFLFKAEKENLPLTVLISTTTIVTRGNIPVASLGSVLVKGEKNVQIFGTHNPLDKTLNAQIIRLYQDMNEFKPRNFEGAFRATSSGVTPATLTVRVGLKEYSVVLPSGAPVLNAKRQIIGLNRFAPGDTVRFYGKVREEDPTFIDAELIRNMSF